MLGPRRQDSSAGVTHGADDSRRSPGALSTRRIVALGALLALILVAIWTSARWEPHDDAYIAFRYADNLAAGRGLVFNPGERVEGYSSTSFVLLVAAGRAAGLEPAGVAAVLNALGLWLLLVVAWRWTFELRRDAAAAGPGTEATPSGAGKLEPGLAAGAATAVVLLHPGVFYYLSSGMETLFFAGIVALAVHQARDVASTTTLRRALLLALTLALVVVTRPEAIGLVGAVGLLLLWHQRALGTRSVLLVLGAAGAAFVALFLFRWLYFGDVVPNTYRAKIGPWDLRRLTRGTEYLLRASPWLAAPLALLPLTGIRWSRGLSFALLPAVWFAFFAWYAGGDWMHGQRLLLPGLVSAAVATGLVAGALWQRARDAGPALRWVALAASLLLVAGALRTHVETLRLVRHNSVSLESFRLFGELLATGPDDLAVGLGAVGAVGYVADRRVVDAFGLTDREIARRGRWTAANTAGHQRADGVAMWRRQPDLVLPFNDASERALTERELLARIEAGDPNRFWLRDLRAQAGFRERYRYETVELSNGRFVGFYRRSDLEWSPGS